MNRMSDLKTIGKVGYFSGLGAFVATLAYCIVQIAQVAKIITFPADEILIYGTSLCIVVPFVLAILSFHYLVSEKKKFWTHAALSFSIIYAVFVTANYVVQLATVIPAKLSGTIDSIRVLDQYPHSLFWNFDAIGYIFMGLTTMMAIPAFEKSGFEKWVRISFIAHSLVTPLITIVYFYPTFSENLLFLGFPWAITAPLFMMMLALLLRKRAQQLS